MSEKPGSVFGELSRSPDEPISEHELFEQEERQKRQQNLKFRRPLFWILIGLLIGEVQLMFGIVILQGFSVMDLDPWVLATFEAGVLIQTFGLVKVITKSLFQPAEISGLNKSS